VNYFASHIKSAWSTALLAPFAVHICAAEDARLLTISSRPDAVSGGDVLVEITKAPHSGWTVQLNDRDVSSAFRDSAGTAYPLALLGDLKLGKNRLILRVGGAVTSRLEIINHALSGPIFSGPHQQPFTCQTEANGLAAPIDANCNAKRIVQYYYKSTLQTPMSMLQRFAAAPGTLDPGFKPYDASALPPKDLSQTVTSDGRTVNYIVRREIGTINRAVYDIQFLHQPGQPLPDPWRLSSAGWNGRLVYMFGGGCGPGYHQGTLGSIGAAQEPLVGEGYAVATATLNIFQNSCNDRLSAETLSMVKEHFIKEFGAPIHTIGEGGSGGAIQVQLIAQNYPGLLDAIVVERSFADEASNSSDAGPTMDCTLLEHAFATSKLRWSDEQMTAVSGFATWRTCVAWVAFKLPIANPRQCDPAIPKELVYDRLRNPKGIRCDIYDNEIAFFGRDPRTGFARRTLDNVGVQYGLLAFRAHKIDVEQFIELNERIGGYDDDGNIVAERSQADPQTVQLAYQRGLVLTGGGGLGDVPILDLREYTDDLADVHDRFRSFVTRARLVAARGSAANQAMLVGPRPEFLAYLVPEIGSAYITDLAQRTRYLMRQMDHWLDAILADRAAGLISAKVARNRPAELADGCWATDGQRIVEPAIYDGPGRCNELYPSHADPRIAAGAPLADDVVKCALKPIDVADYLQPLNAAQVQRLRAVFPQGVCDYSRPGVGQQVTTGTWQHYHAGELR
jgi:hypothetical protein